ncbi:MAG: molecular chaperone HtpG, partial [Clostridia bacterium]|nr:molecular chaperone HtpG [Clostridia bacterium]
IGHGYEVLYLTDDIDEFALQMLHTYSEKEFLNVCKESLDLADDEEKEKLKTENEQSSEMFSFMQASIGDDVSKVQFTNTLQNHPVSLSSEGNVSVGMEKILNKMPGAEDQHIKAEIVLEININHPLAAKLKELFENDKDRLATYSKILFAQARLVSGMSLDNPAEISSLVCNLML